MLFRLLILLTLTSAKPIPPNLNTFYNAVRNSGRCTGTHLLRGGFHDQNDGSPALWTYCQRHMTGQGFYLKGPCRDLANMDIDCDGQDVPGDGRCSGSNDTQFQTRWRDEVRRFGIPDLNTYVHPYVVLGNEGRRFRSTFDPRRVGVRPLSVVAVVCGPRQRLRLVYGIWGDTNGDEGENPIPLVGEASLTLATECFGMGVNASNGYDGRDVLYVAFSGDEAVPGGSARWNTTSYGEFEKSIEALGDRLVATLDATHS